MKTALIRMCAGCGQEIGRAYLLMDGAGRPWHDYCWEDRTPNKEEVEYHSIVLQKQKRLLREAK